MPTRVVLRDDEAAVRRRRTLSEADEFETRPSLVTPPSRIGSPTTRPSVQRSISVNFRTALRDDDDDDSVIRNEMSTDIRGSPRLMGYLSCGLASAVMLVSVMQFYKQGDDKVELLVFRRQLNETGDANATDTSDGEEEDQPTDAVFGSTVLEPKLIGSVAVASAGVFFNMTILLMYMDTFVCPEVWRRVFCDGSVYERNLLLAFIIFEIFSLYVCTSSFSVGEVQANVYFTAWICFFSIVMNYRSWRISAGKKTVQDLLVNGRETAQNWIGTLFFSLVAGISVCDMYAFRDHLTFVIDGVQQTIKYQEWVQVLAVVWSCVGACVLMLIMTFCWKEPKYPCGPRFRFDGRFIEGAVLLVMIGVFFWGITEYTEVDGAISHPSNAYFSIWGAFFFSIATFGTWLKENRNLVTKATRMGSERGVSSGRMSASSPDTSRFPLESDFRTARE